MEDRPEDIALPPSWREAHPDPAWLAGALLLEALDQHTSLEDLWIDEACEHLGSVLRVLHVPAPAFADRMGPLVAPLRENPSTVPRR